MEVLVVTFAYTTPTRDVDTLARIQFIQDMIRNTQGLVTSRFYRGRGASPCYVILTTWESEEAWRQAQERYDPRKILVNSATGLLVEPPEQLLFGYIWGYIRPAIYSEVAAIQLASVRPEQADIAQRGWVEGLKRQVARSKLAFGFLARGGAETSEIGSVEASYAQGSHFLTLLCWAGDKDRNDFYSDVHFTAIRRFISSIGTIRTVALEPL